jgi:hypothetical protein
MPEPTPNVDRFVLDRIDSVPHLEALLLLWSSRPQQWSAEDLSPRLYVDLSRAKDILDDLARGSLLVAVPGLPVRYACEPKSEDESRLLAEVEQTYRHDIIRISTMIHSKASSAVREFAKAFRFKQEKE